MDINSFIDVYYMPVVAAICFGVGYVIKHWLPNDNKWIPTVGGILGAVLGCLACHEISVEAVAKGIISGLAATGAYELYAQHKEYADIAPIYEDDEEVYEDDELLAEMRELTGETLKEPEARG